MKKIDKIRDDWGEVFIRVFECENFEREPQDVPIYFIKSLHKQNDSEI